MKRHTLALAVLTVALAAAGCTFNVNNPEIKDNNLSVNTGDQQDAKVNLSGSWLIITQDFQFTVSLTHHSDDRLTGLASQNAKKIGTVDGRFDGKSASLNYLGDDNSTMSFGGEVEADGNRFSGIGFIANRQ